MGEYCIVLTGLPASGKSTLGAAVAAELGLRVLDKDVYLERLFASRGIGDAQWRSQLSREADVRFCREATTVNRAVLVSHWRALGDLGDSGTPTEWLSKSFSRVVELYCECELATAAKRFLNRRRDPGHLDGRRNLREISGWMQAYERCLPMRLGHLVVASTTEAPDLELIVTSIRAAHNR